MKNIITFITIRRKMKLSEWAKQNNINYVTAWRQWKNGKLPDGVIAKQSKSGSILVEVSKKPIDGKKTIITAIKNIYPEDMQYIIDDFEILELANRLESKIDQKMRKDEIELMRKEIEDLKELVSNFIYSVESKTVAQEEVDQVLDSKDLTNEQKKNLKKKEDLSTKLASGKLGFVRKENKNKLRDELTETLEVLGSKEIKTTT